MAKPAKPAAASDADLKLVITRTFDAPRAAVFKAWVDPAELARWLGPRSIKAEVKKMDARPGGAYRIVMHGEKGAINVVHGQYREMAPPERLVFTWAWEEDGAAHMSGHETLVTLAFKAAGRKTEMTLCQERFDSKASRDSHNDGWAGSFDKLADLLAGRPGIRPG